MIPAVVRRRLRIARRVVFFTGAGMSSESGIPTFRDAMEGLWAKYDPTEVASPKAFKANPQLVWDWYCYRAEIIRTAKPNAGHRAIAQLAKTTKVTVITQNVDSLHQAAGSENVLELHGNIFRLKPFLDEDEAFANGKIPMLCPVCGGYADPDRMDEYAYKEDFEVIQLVAGPVPSCPCCGTLLRPGVVWFGESLGHDVLNVAVASVEACDALICVGSSMEVAPASGLPLRALERGAVVIEVNPHRTAFSAIASVSVSGKAAEVLPVLIGAGWFD
jgi:NAD-dependent deacetylase